MKSLLRNARNFCSLLVIIIAFLQQKKIAIDIIETRL